MTHIDFLAPQIELQIEEALSSNNFPNCNSFYEKIVLSHINAKCSNISHCMSSNCNSLEKPPLDERDIIEISTKMYKIIDSNTVPMHLKPKVVFLLLKLFNRSKEDW